MMTYGSVGEFLVFVNDQKSRYQQKMLISHKKSVDNTPSDQK
jgi:hypothetical protein